MVLGVSPLAEKFAGGMGYPFAEWSLPGDHGQGGPKERLAGNRLLT